MAHEITVTEALKEYGVAQSCLFRWLKPFRSSDK